MKYICQMHDIQTDGESLTLYCKHAALFEFLFSLILLAAFHLCIYLLFHYPNYMQFEGCLFDILFLFHQYSFSTSLQQAAMR